MNVKLIYWEAPWNAQQAMYGEKYPHFGLLLETQGDLNTVLFFTHKKQMVLTTISMSEVNFVELTEVEVPYDVIESVANYVSTRRILDGFADTFLSYVDEHRQQINRVDDLLANTDNGKTPIDKLFDRFAAGDIEQPFPKTS